MKERKKELRKQIALKKTRYCASTLKYLSVKILTLLESHPAFRAAQTVLLYYSMKDEVQTHDFVEKWSKDKRILLPVVVGNDLELRLYSGIQSLRTGSYGIEEPVGEPFTDYESIDMVIVPGVAFDLSGRRLGHGKGYYDRLLPHISAYKAGICFPFQLVEEVPSEEFDIRMDTIITCE